MIGSTEHPDLQRFKGMGLPDAAQELGMEPVALAEIGKAVHTWTDRVLDSTGRYQDIILLELMTGLRPSEIRGLRWRSLDHGGFQAPVRDGRLVRPAEAAPAARPGRGVRRMAAGRGAA